MEKPCSKCKTPFVRTSADTYCKPCRSEYSRIWAQTNREQHNETTKKNRLKYKSEGPVTKLSEKICSKCERVLPLTEEFWNKDRGSSTGFNSICRECSKKKQTTWNSLNPQYKRDAVKKSRIKARLEVLTHYSGGTPVCACCGEFRISFLALDHINGGGNQERKITGEGMQFVYWLKRNGFPEGIQVLCHNCNQSKHSLGVCEHMLTQ